MLNAGGGTDTAERGESGGPVGPPGVARAAGRRRHVGAASRPGLAGDHGEGELAASLKGEAFSEAQSLVSTNELLLILLLLYLLLLL